MVNPVCSFQKSKRSGLSASPAVVEYSSEERSNESMSSCIMRRYIVGGQHKVVMLYSAMRFKISEGMEAIEIVGEHARLHEPLTVVLAPYGLAPAGIGDGEMQAVGTHVVPVLGRHEMRERVAAVMQHHLRVARSAAREIHEHRVERAGLATVERFRGGTHLSVEIDPSLALDARRADPLRP